MFTLCTAGVWCSADIPRAPVPL
ncbi:hypothetical protein E2C01_086224 [Portunus trituberculatus]|uniref:Uncharacterized protein n=1 Tax=Portunus trituberculatus TaxID=210409 RepID=A0A5B7J939_PORTR|nr:hypothetical protein [Portunus trituberculatus]